jgi:hypothetical protein
LASTSPDDQGSNSGAKASAFRLMVQTPGAYRGPDRIWD